MHLASEPIFSILLNIEKRKLKIVRLVSRQWAACASEYLFEKVYVSCLKEGLDIFEAVCGDPLLSQCVKILEYDTVGFLTTMNEDDHVRELWSHFLNLWSHMILYSHLIAQTMKSMNLLSLS